MIHKKCQDLFSLTNKKKYFKILSTAVVIGLSSFGIQVQENIVGAPLLVSVLSSNFVIQCISVDLFGGLFGNNSGIILLIFP